jgi:hypothetical protein
MNNSTVLFFITFFILLSSCKDSGVLVKPKYKTTIFRGLQGDTEVNNFNRKQAEREKSLAETLEKADEAMRRLEDQKKMFYSIDSTERITEIDDQLDKLIERTQQIINSLNLKLTDIEFMNRDGGNIRVFISSHDSLNVIETNENSFIDKFIKMNSSMLIWQKNTKVKVANLVKLYGKLPAVAFPGRATILINLLNLNMSST